ncbi:hypothetical protein [Mariprofundus ferrooxydans]|uniref:hypothetical protein n=1 Tax=Mariprofundus ferrooxydans TaxID=314344 RepID=UPI0014302B30|nr:hypothetical protein [Mariprofundus ferrooxydans]
MKYPPFIYEPDKSIGALAATESFFEECPDKKELITDLGWAYHSIGKTVPQTMENFWSGHFFPYMESWDELQVSFNLMMFGFYKQSFMSLRSALEVGMLSVYYNINDDGHNAVQNWYRSKDTWEANTPRSDKIWKILRSNENIASFDKEFDLKKQFDELGFLHNYVHTKGYKYSNYIGLISSNWQTFEEKGMIRWVNVYERVILLLLTLHLLKYPIGMIEFDWSSKVGIDNPFPVLNTFQVERIKKILPERHIAALEVIAKNDPETQALFTHISDLPDMTEDECEEQIFKLDQMSIEHGPGFIQWKQQELDRMEQHYPESRDVVLKRMKRLEAWATENDMMHPIEERSLHKDKRD